VTLVVDLEEFILKSREPWMTHGLCIGLGEKANKIFYPEGGASTREAKRICNECPVRQECLDYSLRGAEKFGVWGGLTERDRRRLKRTRRQ
jgi:WhiB family redox-sensing transcriptional regulator